MQVYRVKRTLTLLNKDTHPSDGSVWHFKFHLFSGYVAKPEGTKRGQLTITNKKATSERWLNCMIFITKFGGPCWA
ncbi:hypothetical protein CBF17_013885 [Pantoea agglomerans]|nr:hypothetical protein CBF17_013885 [Pantoea agglomerans]